MKAIILSLTVDYFPWLRVGVKIWLKLELRIEFWNMSFASTQDPQLPE